MPNLPASPVRVAVGRKPLHLHLHLQPQLQLAPAYHIDPKPNPGTNGGINQSLPSSGPGLGSASSLGSCLGAVDSPTEFATSPCTDTSDLGVWWSSTDLQVSNGGYVGTRPLKVETPPSPLQQHLRFCRLAVLLDRSVHCNLWLFIAT